jgi:DNA-binding transcriptional LysR family regulator
MDLQALTDFNLVAVHGGFGRASRATGRPKATLSRRVAELEQALGVRLVDRGAHTLRLTEKGRTLHARTEGVLAEITEAGEAVRSGAATPCGRLRVGAPVVLAHVALSAIGARFARSGHRSAGAALLPKLLVDADLDAGRLVHWGTENGAPVEIWALQSSRRLVSAKVRAFLDALDAAFPTGCLTQTPRLWRGTEFITSARGNAKLPVAPSVNSASRVLTAWNLWHRRQSASMFA